MPHRVGPSRAFRLGESSRLDVGFCAQPITLRGQSRWPPARLILAHPIVSAVTSTGRRHRERFTNVSSTSTELRVSKVCGFLRHGIVNRVFFLLQALATL